MQTPSAFISYTHDSDQHCAQVREFAELLVSYGITVKADFWAGTPRRDWYPWANNYTYECEYTLVIASPGYRSMGDERGPNDENLGGRSEAALLRDLIQRDRRHWIERILPVVLPGRSIDEIPDFLQPNAATRYEVTEMSLRGIDDLYRTLTGQPRHVPPVLGSPVWLLPESGPGSPGWSTEEAS